MGRLDEYNRALNAVTTALVGGEAGQGAGQVASNALAAYAAYFIGSRLDPNHGSDPNATLQLLSHAMLGALLAEANGGNAGTGAVSAAGGELAAKVLTNTLTGGDPSKLSPEQKEVVLALSQAVGALAGGLLGWCLGWRNTSGHASCRQESFGNGGVGSCLCNAQHASTLGGASPETIPATNQIGSLAWDVVELRSPWPEINTLSKWGDKGPGSSGARRSSAQACDIVGKSTSDRCQVLKGSGQI